MRIKCYCNLYVSELMQKQKNQIIKNLMERKLQPGITLITLANNERNHLEYFSSALLKQSFYDEKEIFLVGIAAGELDAAEMVREITQEVLDQTGGTEIRTYILDHQKKFEEGRV